MRRLLTVFDAFQQYPELDTVANQTPESLAAMVGTDLRGFVGIPSIAHENRVMIFENELEGFLVSTYTLLELELGVGFNLRND